jgi:hypothetical protein
MSALEKIAFNLNIRNEIPNQLLAKELAASNDVDGTKEIAENLWNKEKNIQSDCLKVLYEIGYLKPELIKDYAPDFFKLLNSKNNRLVWGAMIALSTIAHLKSEDIFSHFDDIDRVMKKGSVITLDNGIKTFSVISSINDSYKKKLIPYLFGFLRKCRKSDIPRYAEMILITVNEDNKKEFEEILKSRFEILTQPQASRVKRILKKLESLS